MQAMILAKTEEERRAALHQLLPMQRADFQGLLKVMGSYPVVIRCSIRRSTSSCPSAKTPRADREARVHPNRTRRN